MKQDVIYEKVAERCSSFHAVGKDSYTNSAIDVQDITCKNCSHFETEHDVQEHDVQEQDVQEQDVLGHCVLDLYDKIVDSNNLSLE